MCVLSTWINLPSKLPCDLCFLCSQKHKPECRFKIFSTRFCWTIFIHQCNLSLGLIRSCFFLLFLHYFQLLRAHRSTFKTNNSTREIETTHFRFIFKTILKLIFWVTLPFACYLTKLTALSYKLQCNAALFHAIILVIFRHMRKRYLKILIQLKTWMANVFRCAPESTKNVH